MSGLKAKILATAFAFSPFAAAAQNTFSSENEPAATGIEVTETPRSAETDGRTMDFESALLAQQGREVLYQVAGLSDGSALYRGHPTVVSQLWNGSALHLRLSESQWPAV